MKKFGIIASFALALVFASNASALPAVKMLEATADGAEISYHGTIEDGSYAVMCKLYGGDGEIDLLSSEVDGGEFSGSFTAPEAGDYKVYCANYEGGDIVSADVTTEEGAKENVADEEIEAEVEAEADEVETPKTFDAGIIGSLAALGAAALIFGSIVWLGLRK